MNEIQRLGGFAALTASATFVVGIVMFVSLLSDYTTGDPTLGESVQFLVDNQAVLRIWNVIIFIVFGIALVPLVLAVHDRLKNRSPVLGQSATAFGLIWAGLVLATGMITNIGIGTVADLKDTDPTRAETVWAALDSVQNGLGGGNEVAGGVWVLLVSLAALRSGTFSAGLNYLGIACGIAGLVTVVPPLEPVGAVFGLGLIIWFVWVGVLLLRESSDQFAGAGDAMSGLSELP